MKHLIIPKIEHFMQNLQVNYNNYLYMNLSLRFSKNYINYNLYIDNLEKNISAIY